MAGHCCRSWVLVWAGKWGGRLLLARRWRVHVLFAIAALNQRDRATRGFIECQTHPPQAGQKKSTTGAFVSVWTPIHQRCSLSRFRPGPSAAEARSSSFRVFRRSAAHLAGRRRAASSGAAAALAAGPRTRRHQDGAAWLFVCTTRSPNCLATRRLARTRRCLSSHTPRAPSAGAGGPMPAGSESAARRRARRTAARARARPALTSRGASTP